MAVHRDGRFAITHSIPMTSPPIAPQLVSRIREGYQLLKSRHPDAGEHALALLRDHPDEPAVIVLAAEHFANNADISRAIPLIEKALCLCNQDSFLKLKKARFLGLARKMDAFIALLESIGEQAHSDPILLWQLGSLCYQNNLHHQAATYLAMAAEQLEPTPSLLYELAVTRHFCGDAQGAEKTLQTLLLVAPSHGAALYLRACLMKQTPASNHVQDLQERLEKHPSTQADTAALLYALAKEHEDCSDFQRSYAALSQATRLKRGTYHYDAKQGVSALDAIRHAYTTDAINAQTAGCSDAGPIFIVGMPRSGTTLCERLLTRTGLTSSAGELHDFGNLLTTACLAAQQDGEVDRAMASLSIDFQELGSRYVTAARAAAGGAPRFIDKMPTNFMFCGMIAKALPNARIIHLVREPLANCYAIHKTHFFNAYGFACDQGELAEYFIAYRRLMQHWHEVMPGKILDVSYERLIEATREETQHMYAWCDLQWSEGVLALPEPGAVFGTASAAQVRQPINTHSLHLVDNYTQQLSLLATRLASAQLL